MDKLNKFISTVGGVDADAAKILGVSPGNLSDWKCGKREIPKYVEFHISVLLSLSNAHLNRIAKERTQ